MIRIAVGKRQPLLLAYLDLDGFKQVNDLHGHEAGDLVLKRFGTAGRAVLRDSDCFGRMGGDEFAVLAPVATVEAASTMAQELHKRFTDVLAGTDHEVTCSMGALVIAPDGAAFLDEVVRKADRLMYAAKHGGKNRLRFDTCAPPLILEFPSSNQIEQVVPTREHPLGVGAQEGNAIGA